MIRSYSHPFLLEFALKEGGRKEQEGSSGEALLEQMASLL